MTLLAMAPANAPEALRKALAMGADRGVLISDPALVGSDALATARVLAAALGRLEFDLVLAGADSSDGGTGTVTPAVAALTGLPYLSYAARIEPSRRSGSGSAGSRPMGYDLIEAPLPALIVATQALGEPRYPSLKGIMAARSKEIATWTLADLGIDPATVGAGAATNRVVEALDPAVARRHPGGPRAGAGRRRRDRRRSSSSGGSSDGRPDPRHRARSAPTAGWPGSRPSSPRSPAGSPRPAASRPRGSSSRRIPDPPPRSSPATCPRCGPSPLPTLLDHVAPAAGRGRGPRGGRGRPLRARGCHAGRPGRGRDALRPPRLGRPGQRRRRHLGRRCRSSR